MFDIFSLLWTVAHASSPLIYALFLAPVVAEALVISVEAAAVIITVASVALSVGVSYAANTLLAKKPDQQAPEVGGVQLDLRIDTDLPEVLIVGRATTAGSLAHRETYGKRGEIDNSDMVEIIAIADHRITAFVSTILEEKVAAFTPSNPALEEAERAYGTFAENRGQVVNGYNSKLAVQFYDGTQTTADPLAVAALASHSERPWTTQHYGRDRAYLRIHSIYDKELVTGPLSWRVVVDGIALYDPRKDSTVAGGSGSHRFDNLNTHEFTSNLAVIAYNILRGIRVKDDGGTPRHFYGIENGSAASCPLDNWFAAMNECDVEIDGEPQFHGGGEISVDTEPLETVKQIVKACAGRFSELGGVYKLRLGAPGLPVLTITDDDLRADEADDFKPILPQEQRVNYITGKFTSPEDGWIPKVAPVRTDASMEALDGRRIPADLDVPMVQSAAHCQRLQLNLLLRSRRERRHGVPLPPVAFGLEPGDVIEWTSTRHGYAAKLFEVDAADLFADLNSTAAITEVDHADYDWNAGTDLIDQPVGSLVTNRPAPKIIEGFDAVGIVHQGSNSVARAAIKVTWEAGEDGDAARVEVQVRRSVVLADTATFTTDVPQAEEMIILAALTPATPYQVRGRFVSFNGYPADWSLWIDVTTPDVRVIQAELSAQLDARVRQVIDQLPGLIADLRSDLGELSASLGDQVSGMKEEQGRLRLGVGSRYQENSAAVQQALIAMANGDGALAALITALTATVGGNTAAISDELIARANGDNALAGRITDLTAVVGNNSGAIHDESIARAGGDNALAARLIRLLATGPGGSAEGRIRFVTSSAPSGAIASIAIEVNVSQSTAEDWQPSGIYLDAMIGFSRIRLDASLIQLRHAALNGGEPFSMFEISAGEALFNVLIRARRIAAEAIDAGSITTQKLAADSAVYNRNYAGSTGGSVQNNQTTTVTLMSATFPVERGNIMIMGAAGGSAHGWAGDTISAAVYIDGGLQQQIFSGAAGNGDGSAAGFSGNVFFCVAGVALGNHTVEVKITQTGVGGIVGNAPRIFNANGSMAFFEPRT